MGAHIALAVAHHDPEGRLYDQMARMLPHLSQFYCHITAIVTPAIFHATRDLLQQAGVTIYHPETPLPTGVEHLGRARFLAVEKGLHNAPEATHVHYCDFDRVLHWAEFHGAELRRVLAACTRADFTVLGRTPRAFASHPRVQRDTEALINHTFGLASGHDWDVTAGSRGVSRRAADRLAACGDDTIGVDCSWPLFLQQHDDLQMHYIPTEGLEFETLDRYGDQIAELGGADAWIARMDGDVAIWLHRLELTRIEVASVVAYSGKTGR